MQLFLGWLTTDDPDGDVPGSQLYDGPEEEEQEGGETIANVVI
jgi:hypothetical protein